MLQKFTEVQLLEQELAAERLINFLVINCLTGDQLLDRKVNNRDESSGRGKCGRTDGTGPANINNRMT